MLLRRGVLLAFVIAANCRTADGPRVVRHYRADRPTTLMLGDSMQLQPTVCTRRFCGPDSTLTLTTSDTAVAFVDSAVFVHARGLGRATLVLAAEMARPETIVVGVIPRVARLILTPRRATVYWGDTALFTAQTFDAAGHEISGAPVRFDHWTTSGRRPTWSSSIPMIGSKAGTYSIVARIGAVADTSMFVVAKARRPRLRVPLLGEWPLTTDSIRYTALPTDKVWTPVYTFRVVATFHNRSGIPVYLDRCYPTSRHPTYAVIPAAADNVLNPREEAAYNIAWACVGHEQPIEVSPGTARTDTLLLRGPNSWDGRTHKPFGATEGRFQIVYGVKSCRGEEGCTLPVDRGLSNAFEVRIPR